MSAFPRTEAPAIVVDLTDMSCFEAFARDISSEGCWLVSNRVDLLKEHIGLQIEGIDKLVRGKVVAFGDDEARVTFHIDTTREGDQRREARRPVLIDAVVCGRTNSASIKCRIVDASRSGCRLESDGIQGLSDDVEIFIPKLDLPIPGTIVWRNGHHAGVSLAWPFETGAALTPNVAPPPVPEEKTAKDPAAPAERSPGGKKTGRKKRISAFGG